MQEQVAAGAKLLDEKRPGWAKEVNLNTLEMNSFRRCMLGQLYGEYYKGRDLLNIEDSAYYGFNVLGSYENASTGVISFDALATLWKQEVKKRLAA